MHTDRIVVYLLGESEMSISADELAHLARLANLRLDEHDQDKLRSQIDQILAFVEKLQSCDLE
jgi:aspartyl/glutamyl-tRNA(Asn/Gln) amidotransferase C subunit